MSYLNNKSLPRGLRNNNVGNLIKTNIPWKGKIPHSENQDERFEQFYEFHYGIRAMMKDIANDIKKGANTVEKLIHQYAPPFENNTKAYVAYVAEKVGVSTTEPLAVNEQTIKNLSRSIAIYENGFQYADMITEAEINKAWDISGISEVKNVSSVKKKKCTMCGHQL